MRSTILLVLFLLLLGVLSCSRPATPPAPAPPSPPARLLWRVQDNGKRCVVAPCASWTATELSSHRAVEITAVDLSGLRLDPKLEVQFRDRLLKGIMVAEGEILTVPRAGPGGDGTVLQVKTMGLLPP